jgi:dTDP-4-amino-4,6-dideoxygalactose transaminase
VDVVLLFSAIVLAGALPVLAEVDTSFNNDPGDIEQGSRRIRRPCWQFISRQSV